MRILLTFTAGAAVGGLLGYWTSNLLTALGMMYEQWEKEDVKVFDRMRRYGGEQQPMRHFGSTEERVREAEAEEAFDVTLHPEPALASTPIFHPHILPPVGPAAESVGPGSTWSRER